MCEGSTVLQDVQEGKQVLWKVGMKAGGSSLGVLRRERGGERPAGRSPCVVAATATATAISRNHGGGAKPAMNHDPRETNVDTRVVQ